MQKVLRTYICFSKLAFGELGAEKPKGEINTKLERKKCEDFFIVT